MTAHIAGMSPRSASTLIGLMYVILIVGGLFAGVYVREALIVPGDAEATALGILENQALYRSGVAVSLFILGSASLYHFDGAQIQALAYVYPRLFSDGLGISLVFFGFLALPVARALFPYVLAPALVAPFALAYWFLFRGVDARRWEAVAS